MRSVAVFLSKTDDKILRNFRCINCGKIVFQYQGCDVRMVYDDEIEMSEGSSIDPMCQRCKVVYKLL